MTDITEQRATEDQLRASDRHKDEFLAILAHELRNPLAPIRSVRRDPAQRESERARHASYAVEVIGRQTSNLIRLVDDLLDINRINQGKIVLQLATIDLRNVDRAGGRDLSAVDREPQARAQRARGRAARARSRRHGPARAGGHQPSDERGELHLAGRPYRHRARRAGRDPGEAVVTVTDNGIGIPAEMVARIFEPYQQVSQAHERATGGLGLGLTRLPTARWRCTAAASRREATARAAARASSRVSRSPEPCSASAAEEPSRTAPAGAPLRVLIVDDNRDAAESLATPARDFGHDVRVASNGAAAIAAAGSVAAGRRAARHRPARHGRVRGGAPPASLPVGPPMLLIAMTGYGGAARRVPSRPTAASIIIS